MQQAGATQGRAESVQEEQCTDDTKTLSARTLPAVICSLFDAFLN